MKIAVLEGRGGENMKRNILIVISMAFIIGLCGCDSIRSSRGDVSGSDQTYATKVDNPQVRQFDGILTNVSNEGSAQIAINTFVGYVESRLITKEAAIQISGILDTPDAIKEMARQEAEARSKSGISLSADPAVPTKPLLDIGTVTDSINELGSGEGVRVDDETVIKARSVVEASMPNINPDKRSGMTPLEAAIIGYAIVSGDDGTAPERSINLNRDKLYMFIEKITN